ncbi:MAG: WYL domain-containing protein [Ruminococcus flavefaciens]|nr:WYL domain-containing protein [Ruminococcus flavefaciens]MCM1380761.1 WYL domain-containing protein [Muribaculaceae bacterium]
MNNFSGYGKNKIRYNISNNALYILESDTNCFENSFRKGNYLSGTTINTIIKNVDFGKITEPCILPEKNEQYVKIRNDTGEKLAGVSSETVDVFGGKVSLFLSAVLEYYARKPYFERELIYFKDIIDKINLAKSEKKIIKVIHRGKPYSLYPFGIITDEWSSYNYLIGTLDKVPKIVNLRISFISSVASQETPENYTPPLSDAKIGERIKFCGVQFVSAEPEIIKVRLPEGKGNGKDMYDHMVFMRPKIYEMPAESEPDIYTFKCTLGQAKFYFFKFGTKAEIISPDNLRNQFLLDYKEAYEFYKNAEH